jgi:hypothetical protein
MKSLVQLRAIAMAGEDIVIRTRLEGLGEAGREAIMPLERGPDGSLGVRAHGGSHVPAHGDVVVNVYDQRTAGEPIQATSRTGIDGRRFIELLVRDQVNRAVADGALDRTLTARFGLRSRGS